MKQNRRIACYLSHSHAHGGIQSPTLLLKGHYASYLAGIMIILRHCESEFNRHYNLHGGDPGLEDPHLSAEGKAHAQDLALKLADRGIRRILVSPFTRALQTATPLAQRLRNAWALPRKLCLLCANAACIRAIKVHLPLFWHLHGRIWILPT
ncbi:phosphoglycerate mutase family protein [Acetobacter pasteurianus]|uniref:phosphoglycerate mutase family protein n=1 Tax=Acetobacter pasteurianus TaxID=438 RepID=UPI0035A22E3D